MPIYDYECRDCGHKFDEFGRITDHPVAQCPACGRFGVVRLISGATVVVEMGSREYFRRVIEPEAKRIAGRVGSGDEAALADILGEDKVG